MLKTKWMVVMSRDHVRIKAYFWPDLRQEFDRKEIRDAVFWHWIRLFWSHLLINITELEKYVHLQLHLTCVYFARQAQICF